MSTIFNYDVPGVARSYDRLRQPFGVDVVAGLLQVHCGKSLKVFSQIFEPFILISIIINSIIDIIRETICHLGCANMKITNIAAYIQISTKIIIK